jgi:nascent polypeptide-associated complex subunit alpha
MPKLPKELQAKKNQQKMLRSQGGAPSGPAAPTGKGMNRQMRRRMKSQGIEGMEPIEAKRVIIQTEEGNLVIEEPQVIKLNQQGMEIYQVIGKAQSSEGEIEGLGGNEIEGEIVESNGNILGKTASMEEESSNEPVNLNAEITQQDIELVAMQTGASVGEAEQALKDAGGDLARAILNLKSK